MKKVGENTRSYRYDLKQIPYDCAVDMAYRFKGLDLRDKVPERPRMEDPNIVQKAVIKTIPKIKNCMKAN